MNTLSVLVPSVLVPHPAEIALGTVVLVIVMTHITLVVVACMVTYRMRAQLTGAWMAFHLITTFVLPFGPVISLIMHALDKPGATQPQHSTT